MESLLIYYQKWNIPFHKFFVRHMLIPLVNFGFNERFGVFLIFIYSGLFHEAIVAIPLKIFTGWFLIMMIAIPIPCSILVGRLNNKYKYIVNWTIFIMIWPLLALLYCPYFIKSNNRVIHQISSDLDLKI